MHRGRILMLTAALVAMSPAMAAPAAEGVRPEVGKPLQDAQKALQAKDYAAARDKLAAAEKVGSLTPYETYIINRLRAAVAASLGDAVTAVAAYEAALQAPQFPADEKAATYEIVARLSYAAKDYPKAARYLQQYRDAGGTTAATLSLMPQALYLSGDIAAAQREMLAQLAALEQAGQAPTDLQLKLLASCAQKLQDDAGYVLALEKLLRYHPDPAYWPDLLSRVRNQPGFSPRLMLDVYRLRAASGTMADADDDIDAAQLALQAGYPGEADRYLRDGYARQRLGTGPDAARHQQLRELVARKLADDQATLAEGDKAAASQATGDALVSSGLNRIGYGQYEQGLQLIQAGIAKGGLKKPDEARLHLGYAQLQAGRKTDAHATLASVQGADGSAALARLYALLP